jgi:hypothetical protein
VTVATVDSIAQAAQDLLDAAEAALQTTDAGFSGQAFLNPGLPAFDSACDFVCVWMGGEALAGQTVIPTSQQFRTGPRVNLVTLNVTAGRCVHVGTGQRPPTLAEKTADAVVHMQDGQALWVGVGDAISDGLFDGTCRQVWMQGLTAIVPQGQVAGWNLVVVVQIDGYPIP